MVTRNSLPQNFMPKQPVVMDDMSSIANWTVNNTAVSLDTVNSGVKITQTSTPTAFSTAQKSSVALDFSDCDYIELDLFIDGVYQTAGASNFSSATFYMFNVLSSKYFQVGFMSVNLRNGFNRIKILKKDFTSNGGADWSLPIVAYKLAIGGYSVGTATHITILSLKKGYKGIPKVLFTFDDGFKTQYDNAYPIMAAKGFRGVCALISSAIQGTVSTYMRKTQTDELYNAGWDMCNHTANHTYLTQQSDNGLVEMKTCRDWLLSCNYTRSSDFMCYPYGDLNDSVINVAKSLGMKLGRLASITGYTDSGNYYDQHYTNHLPIDDKYRLRVIALGYGGLTVSQIKSYIDEAVNFGNTIVFMAHNIIPSGCANSNDYLISDFQAIVDYVAIKGIDVVTLSEWYEQMTNPRKLISRF